jgi:hypothetical protein
MKLLLEEMKKNKKKKFYLNFKFCNFESDFKS